MVATNRLATDGNRPTRHKTDVGRERSGFDITEVINPPHIAIAPLMNQRRYGNDLVGHWPITSNQPSQTW